MRRFGPADVLELISFSRLPVIRATWTDALGMRDAIAPLVSDRGTAIYDAVARAADEVNARPETHRAVVVLTDGMDNASVLPLDTAAAFVRRAGAQFAAIGFGIRPGGSEEAALTDLSTKSGGRYFNAPTPAQLDTVYATVAGSLGAAKCCDLFYRSPKPMRDSTVRRIHVAVTDGVNILATADGSYSSPRSVMRSGVDDVADRPASWMEAYPNPSGGETLLSIAPDLLSSRGVVTLRISDALGRVVATVTRASAADLHIDASALPAGAYACVASGDRGAARALLVVRH
jgi:hypothetical protein